MWPTIYGQNNDTIVPLDSALNNLTGVQFSGVVHTAALDDGIVISVAAGKTNIQVRPPTLDYSIPVSMELVPILRLRREGGRARLRAKPGRCV